MEAGPVRSSLLPPVVQAASPLSELYAAPHSVAIRLPSLAPRLPTLPSLMSTFRAPGVYTNLSPTRASPSISNLLVTSNRQPVENYYLLNQQQVYAPGAPSTILYHSYTTPASSMPISMTTMQPQAIKVQPKKKRKTRICKFDGCEKYVVDRGLCIRHGGGKRCSVEGCSCRAQNRGLCWKHGGYTHCTVEGCSKRAKSRGICWSHGGGTRCKTGGCIKIAVSNGLCWAHGGGKRCLIDSCQKPAYERNGNLCAEHCSQRTQPPEAI
ncbi:hypothetical protein CCR75_002632 [Bremia lactucae]|uniref:WRKY19-like zinc finger domain-containing protein n=1 Tax=Bremia lactucae TaxID=4779 RepID=A0A976IL05_BRELC|nr:hypothetical protein CCR75_002632 [Bremia lactucae]